MYLHRILRKHNLGDHGRLGTQRGIGPQFQRAADRNESMSLHREVLPFNLAIVQLGLGDRQRALDYLERAYVSDSQWMGWLNKDRMFDPLRSEPRFAALMRKLRRTSIRNHASGRARFFGV
jgi:hypothetical protein